MPKTYLVAVRWAGPSLPLELVDAQLEALGAWFRYNGTTWLVSTSASAREISQRVRSAISIGDGVLVLRIDPLERDGFAPQEVWTWLDANAPVNYLARRPAE